VESWNRATDSEGFDPYADSVGVGIFGGVVKRDGEGKVVIGEQYQGHNPRRGPVYAGGGYTPTLGRGAERAARQVPGPAGGRLDGRRAAAAHVRHVGALPGRGGAARGARRGREDTYGYTALHRMASNNLAVGAKALLDGGADPTNEAGAGAAPLQVARQSAARDVVRVLEDALRQRKEKQ